MGPDGTHWRMARRKSAASPKRSSVPDAAKVGKEPFLTNAAERLDGRFGGPAA
jgi:hypothetical protein